MQRHVIGLVALDLVLRIVGARVMRISLVGHVFLMHPHDPAADPAGFGIPADVIADFEELCHFDTGSRADYQCKTTPTSAPMNSKKQAVA